MKNAPADLWLNAPLDPDFLPVATGFAEQAAMSLGLGRAEALRLTLAAEEVFSYLCQVSRPGDTVRLEAQGLTYCVRLTFGFQTRRLDLRLLNLTVSPSPDSQDDLDGLGLLLASRSVERFAIQDQGEQGLMLVLIKEKAYPSPIQTPAPAVPALKQFQVRTARQEDLLILAQQLGHLDAAEPCPRDFTIPGKLMDMVACGEYGALAALDRQGNLGGAILWRQLGQSAFWNLQGASTLLCYGPYVFGQPVDSALPAALVEGCLGQLARGDALGLISTHPTSWLPLEYFEKLGSLQRCDPQGRRLEQAVYYRGLKEDPGSVAWTSPEVEPFLAEQYRRLAFARHLRQASHQGQSRPEHSVLGSRFNRSQGQAILHPMWDGMDFEANLERHLRAFLGDGLGNIFCEMDLAVAWQAACAPALKAQGFVPRVVMPHAGKGDLLLWQYAGD